MGWLLAKKQGSTKQVCSRGKVLVSLALMKYDLLRCPSINIHQTKSLHKPITTTRSTQETELDLCERFVVGIVEFDVEAFNAESDDIT